MLLDAATKILHAEAMLLEVVTTLPDTEETLRTSAVMLHDAATTTLLATAAMLPGVATRTLNAEATLLAAAMMLHGTLTTILDSEATLHNCFSRGFVTVISAAGLRLVEVNELGPPGPLTTPRHSS
jgi:hypothetical protein